MFNGREYHRSHPIWEGTRVSFVAFLHEAYEKVTPRIRSELVKLGFVMPSEEFVGIWEAEKLRQARRRREDYEVEVNKVMVEALRKGAQTSYKARGKKGKQEELFPDLEAEIAKKRAERETGKSFTAKERFGKPFREELAKLAMDRIGGDSRAEA